MSELENKCNNNKIDENNREEREYREQAVKSLNQLGSQCKNDPENNENNLIANVVNSIDTQPLTPNVVKVLRPSFVCHSDYFSFDGKNVNKPGLYWHYIAKEGNTVDDYICTPIYVEAITSNTYAHDFGRQLRFIDSNGKWHTWGMPMKLLSGSGEELLEELLDQGLVFNREKRNKLIDYIMNFKPTKRILAACTVGWHDKIFVLPNKVIGGDTIVFQSELSSNRDFCSSGTISEWQEKIGRFCAGNVPLMISVSAALAGVLLVPLNRQQGGGIHWVGDSSSGKSTSIEVAASVWGSYNFVRSWSATANGLEGMAANRNDTCLILDEIDEASPQDISKIVYMLVNGQGKQRAGRTGTARNIQRWRTIVISTGERTLSSIMSDIQKKPNSGQLVRLLNIRADFEHGVFSNLHGLDSGRHLADHLKAARMAVHGVIGPEFVKKLLNDTRNLSDLYDGIMKLYGKHTKSSLDNRAISTVAIIVLAGELGIEYGLLPWETGSLLSAGMKVYSRWRRTANGVGFTEDERILDSVKNFIDKNASSRFSNIDFSGDKTINNRVGFYKVYKDGNQQEIDRVYMLFGCALEEAGDKYDRSRIVQALKKADWIVEHDGNRLTKKTKVEGGYKNLYYIKIKDKETIISVEP